MPQDEDKEAQRKLRRERAKAEEDRARDALVRHIQEQDRRLQNSRLQKEAAYQKRIAGEVARRLATPARREMYDDRALALAQQVPGPGQYTPRLQSKDNAGTTFGAAPFAKQGDPAGDGGLSGGPSSASTVYDRDAGSPDAWRVKAAAAQPGPASYSPNRPRGACGSTFGLPPELRGGKVVPPAHDLTNLVNHLRDLPAPDAYSPRNPMEKNKGFRIVPSNARSSLEQVRSGLCGSIPLRCQLRLARAHACRRAPNVRLLICVQGMQAAPAQLAGGCTLPTAFGRRGDRLGWWSAREGRGGAERGGRRGGATSQRRLVARASARAHGASVRCTDRHARTPRTNAPPAVRGAGHARGWGGAWAGNLRPLECSLGRPLDSHQGRWASQIGAGVRDGACQPGARPWQV